MSDLPAEQQDISHCIENVEEGRVLPLVCTHTAVAQPWGVKPTVELLCSTKPMLPPARREKNRPPVTVSGLAASYALAASRVGNPRTADAGIGRPGLLVQMAATMACSHATPASDAVWSTLQCAHLVLQASTAIYVHRNLRTLSVYAAPACIQIRHNKTQW